MLKNENLKNIFKIFLLFCLIFWSGLLFAQDIGRRQFIDTSAVKYLSAAGNQAVIYNGEEQSLYLRSSNHPYQKDEQYAKARLSYNQVIYPEVLLRLDLCRDELVILSPDQRNIVMFSENVDFVELHDRMFIYLRRDSLPGCPSSGFYNLLHSANCKILKKIIATQMEKIDVNGINRYYDFSTNFYLYKDGVYYIIRNKRVLLKVLHSHKKELKHFISTHRLNFRRNAEEFLIRTVDEYEKLSEI